jgi:hypothetical protein
MHYTITTPPSSRPAERPTPIDDALVAEARSTLSDALGSLPFAASLNRRTSEAHFRAPMTALCGATYPRDVPIEKLIVAIKLAWGSLAEARLRLGESAPDALAGAVTACIEAYFAAEERRRTD